MKKLSESVNLYGYATEIYNNLHEVDTLTNTIIDKGAYLRCVIFGPYANFDATGNEHFVHFEEDTPSQDLLVKMYKGIREGGVVHVNTIPITDSCYTGKRNRAIPFSSYRQNI